jgi:hypothetical protein
MHGIDFTPHIEKLKSWEEVFKDRAMKDRREHIATQALSALIITCNTTNRCADPDTYVVKTAVKLADRLIKELDKPPRKKRAKKQEKTDGT